jgi:molybdopterin-guanine dinucleotide biosynthesis protein A
MGRPKAWLRFGTERLLERVAREVSRAVGGPVVVVAGPVQDVPTLPAGVRLVRDVVAGRGPLSGLLNGLLEMPEAVEWVYVTGVDSPLLAEGWVERLLEEAEGVDLVMPRHEGYGHPLSALYGRRASLEAAEALLDAGGLRLLDLAGRLRTRWVEAETLRDIDPRLGTLRNLNTRSDYRSALAEAGFEPTEDEDGWGV